MRRVLQPLELQPTSTYMTCTGKGGYEQAKEIMSRAASGINVTALRVLRLARLLRILRCSVIEKNFGPVHGKGALNSHLQTHWNPALRSVSRCSLLHRSSSDGPGQLVWQRYRWLAGNNHQIQPRNSYLVEDTGMGACASFSTDAT